MSDKILLHRDDPTKEPLVGHVKVTREDWVNVARDILVNHGVAEVKILAMAERLKVSRSSFYWYFKGRQQLLDAMLTEWEETNTATILHNCALPAKTISAAVCNFFRCFVSLEVFDPGLDFAVREWARREASIRARIDVADANRIAAVAAMFERFGYAKPDADARARILYFMQLGYHALEVRESMATRMGRLEAYLEGFTGVSPDPDDIAEFVRFCLSLEQEK